MNRFQTRCKSYSVRRCEAYFHILDDNRKKLNSKAIPCLFIGYGDPLGIKGYCLYSKLTNNFFTNHNVIFNEDLLLSEGVTQLDPHPSL